MQINEKVSEYLLELIRCGVSDAVPNEKPEGISWKNVYDMAKNHSVSALCFRAVGKLKNLPEQELWKAWTEQNAKLLVKCVNQENEAVILSKAFEENRIPYMLLKGSVLRTLFRMPYLREMADIDILISRDRKDNACEIANSLGYQFISSVVHHVELQKPPYMTLELHTDLIGDIYEYYSYYQDPWCKAKLTYGSYGYSMSNEDFYLYLLTHSAKHYYNSGTGIRSVLDVYIFNRAYRSTMDMSYVDAELEKLNLSEFAAQIEELAEYWFSPVRGTDSVQAKDMANYILSSATYGTRNNRNANIIRNYMKSGKSEKGAKAAMYLHMAFLPCDEMQLMFPVLKKAPVLLPFCWIARWFRIIFTKPKSISNSYKRVQDIQIYDSKKDS